MSSNDYDLHHHDRGGEQSGHPAASPETRELPMPEIGDAELGALHIRIIALENLLVAMLAQASDQQIELARDMAHFIAPREGFTPHPLTVHAAAHMTDLIARSARFAGGELPGGRVAGQTGPGTRAGS